MLPRLGPGRSLRVHAGCAAAVGSKKLVGDYVQAVNPKGGAERGAAPASTHVYGMTMSNILLSLWFGLV